MKRFLPILLLLLTGCHLHVHFDSHYYDQDKKATARSVISDIFTGEQDANDYPSAED